MNKLLSNQSPYLLLILATMIWGGNFVIGRAIVGELPPFTLSFLRWILAALIFIPFVWGELVIQKEKLLKHWRPLLLMSLTGIAGFNTMLYAGLHYTTSINASLVNTTAPVLFAALAYFILKEGINKNQVKGIILSLAGVLLIFSQGSLDILLTFSFNIGDLIVFAAVILWTLYSIIIKHSAYKLPQLSSLAVTMVGGIFILFPFFFWEIFISGKEVVWSLGSVATIGYVGIFASVVAFLSWNNAVSKIGPGKAGIFLLLIPVFTTIFAIIFIGESLKWYQLVGGILAITGIYLSTRVGAQNKINTTQKRSVT
ncbi:DMT family transporter [Bacillaceae bacterium IKA-2]|nr:DMT family transporter [Bacillaceae bacterium IKA-2]